MGYRVAVVGDKYNNPLFRSSGLLTVEAFNQDDAVSKVYELSRRGDVALIIVLKHLITDEDKFMNTVKDLDKPILILPTRWSKAEPVNIDKLIARALGLG